MNCAKPDNVIFGKCIMKPPKPSLIGLLITRDDEAIFDDWCREQLRFYTAVVCLDGSTTDRAEKLARKYSQTLIYLHERDFSLPHKTDHGLRRVVHDEIVQRFGTGNWIMCCHVDEFCYHDPRKIASLAERQGYDLVSWYSPHFYPHPSELDDWTERAKRPVFERHRHYHWGHVGTGLPWIEDRLYRAREGVAWDDSTHGSVRPHGLRHVAPFHPILQHYKVVAPETSWCEVIGDSTYYRHHWVGLENRTGLPYEVHQFEDLFVSRIRNYGVCDRFQGTFDQPWNLGDELRPDGALGRLPGEPSAQENAVEADASSVSRRRFQIDLGDTSRDVDMSVRGVVDTSIIEDLWQRDTYGLRSLTSLRPRTIVDIGAHIGAFSVMASELWPDARIIACEADPDNAALLREHTASRTNVEIVEAAIVDRGVSNISFNAVLDKAASNSGGGSCFRPEPGSVRIQVPAVSVLQLWDEKAIGYCDLLKLDCEGCETMLLSKLSEAGRLGRVGRIVAEWHAASARKADVTAVREKLRSILTPTHNVLFAERRTGREGYFAASPRFDSR